MTKHTIVIVGLGENHPNIPIILKDTIANLASAGLAAQFTSYIVGEQTAIDGPPVPDETLLPFLSQKAQAALDKAQADLDLAERVRTNAAASYAAIAAAVEAAKKPK